MGFRIAKTWSLISRGCGRRCSPASRPIAYALAHRGEEPGDAGAANPESAATDDEYDRPVRRPAAAGELYAQGDALIPGGPDAFEAELAKLSGTRWSSTTGPPGAGRAASSSRSSSRRRAEHGERVAFLGVDSPTTDAAAETFLERVPGPYPSVTDPDRDIWPELLDPRTPGDRLLRPQGERVYVQARSRIRRPTNCSPTSSATPARGLMRVMRARLTHIWLRRSRTRLVIWLVLAAGAVALAVPGAGAQSQTSVPSIELDGTIDPATEKWIDSALDDAADDGRAAGDHPPRHPGRARELDARDRQGDHRRPDAGRRLRLARTAPAPPPPACSSPRRRTSPRWRRRPTSARRRVTSIGGDIGGHARAEDRKRRRRFHSRARRGPRPQRRPAEQMVTEAANVTATEALDAQGDRPDRRQRGRPAPPARRLSGQGPEGADARHRRPDDRPSETCRSSTSCCRSSSTRTSPSCCFSLGLIGIAIEIFSPGLILPGHARGRSRSCSAPTARPSCRSPRPGSPCWWSGSRSSIAEAHLPPTACSARSG